MATVIAISNPIAYSAKQFEADEYEVKAAFLYNVANFVEWPSASFSGRDAAIVVGIVGPDLFGTRLDRMLSGRRVNGRPFRPMRFSIMNEARGCHIVFVN